MASEKCHVGIVVRLLDGRRVLVERRIPLVRLAALEAPQQYSKPRPVGQRSNGPAALDLVVRRVVPLAERGGAVAVLLEDLGDARRVLGPLAVVAGEAGRQLRDDAGVDRVVIAPRSSAARVGEQSAVV